MDEPSVCDGLGGRRAGRDPDVVTSTPELPCQRRQRMEMASTRVNGEQNPHEVRSDMVMAQPVVHRRSSANGLTGGQPPRQRRRLDMNGKEIDLPGHRLRRPPAAHAKSMEELPESAPQKPVVGDGHAC